MPVKKKKRPIPSYYFSEEWKTLRRTVLARDGHKCKYCGNPANQADHVISRGRGGPDSLSNLVAACQPCNKIAGGKYFTSVDKKREYIMAYRRKRYQKKKQKKWSAIFGDWKQ